MQNVHLFEHSTASANTGAFFSMNSNYSLIKNMFFRTKPTIVVFPKVNYDSFYFWCIKSLQNLTHGCTQSMVGQKTLTSFAKKLFNQMSKIIECVVQLKNKNPKTLFDMLLIVLLFMAVLMKCLDHHTSKQAANQDKCQQKNNLKPASVKSLQWRYLPVFLLLRITFWMSGPYFYAAYASKLVNGKPMTMTMISHIFLVGFASIALFGPTAGRLMDQHGHKKGTIAAALVYALGAISTQSSTISVMFVGRALGGIGTSLMGSAPEAWLIGEFQSLGKDISSKWLSETFGLAYSMDSILAIVAGQVASYAAQGYGPTGPFQLSPIFLALAGGITALFWSEDVAQNQKSTPSMTGYKYKYSAPSIRNALDVVMADPKLIMLGAIQSLFESSMYIFVMIWPRAMDAAIRNFYDIDTYTPYGTIFSCFMACCMFGSSIFGKLVAKQSISTESSCIVMLAVAFLSLTVATISLSGSINLIWLILTFFIFEACVGMYFPSIGTLRSKLLPNSHRSAIMTLFGVPLNVLVVSVFLSINKIGTVGAMNIAAVEIGIATICMIRLRYLHTAEAKK